jgi:hypothetical protein
VKEAIYLKVSRTRVEGMYKSLPAVGRYEIPVKVVVEVKDNAFREPTIERHVTVTDWRDGIELADVELREGIITEAEAEVIKKRRLAQMRAVLEERGYSVTEPPADDENADG